MLELRLSAAVDCDARELADRLEDMLAVDEEAFEDTTGGDGAVITSFVTL